MRNAGMVNIDHFVLSTDTVLDSDMLGALIYRLWSSVLNVKKRSGESRVHRCFLFFG
jgi:hypothetical protein